MNVDRRRLWAGVGRSVSGVHDQVVVYARGEGARAGRWREGRIVGLGGVGVDFGEAS